MPYSEGRRSYEIAVHFIYRDDVDSDIDIRSRRFHGREQAGSHYTIRA